MSPISVPTPSPVFAPRPPPIAAPVVPPSPSEKPTPMRKPYPPKPRPTYYGRYRPGGKGKGRGGKTSKSSKSKSVKSKSKGHRHYSKASKVYHEYYTKASKGGKGSKGYVYEHRLPPSPRPYGDKMLGDRHRTRNRTLTFRAIMPRGTTTTIGIGLAQAINKRLRCTATKEVGRRGMFIQLEIRRGQGFDLLIPIDKCR